VLYRYRPRILLTIVLNARTNYVGEIRVEVIGFEGHMLPGRTFDDCDSISGNFLDRPVTWNGKSHIHTQSEKPFALRIRMASAQLFSITFV